MEKLAMNDVTDAFSKSKKYNILRKLGEGGFATVYLAEDTTLDRKVAIKILKQLPVDNPTFLKRF
jgi:serine/threonine protein kinase